MDGETIIAILVGAALACFSLLMVGYSFFRGDRHHASEAGRSSAAPEPQLSEPPPAEGPDAIGVGLQSIYDSIDTLELEYQLGNLPEEQYRQQLQTYRLEAAAAIKSQLEHGTAPPELLLEQEVMAARAEIRPDGPQHLQEQGDSSVLAVEWQPCPQCDAPIPAALGLSNGSCPHCGGHLSESGFEDSQDEESC